MLLRATVSAIPIMTICFISVVVITEARIFAAVATVVMGPFTITTFSFSLRSDALEIGVNKPQPSRSLENR